MRIFKLALFASLLAGSGCAVLEQIGNGFGNLASELDGQPVVYASISIEAGPQGAESRHYVSAITIVENREGRADGVVYEGLRSADPVIDFESASFPGLFSALSLRDDNRSLAGVLEEFIPDTTEYYAFIVSLPSGEIVKNVTDSGIARDAFEQCFDRRRVEQDVDRFVQEFYGAPNEPPIEGYEVSYDYLASGGPNAEWFIAFQGWTSGGQPVFSAGYFVSVEIRLPGASMFEVFPLSDMSSYRPGDSVVFSARTGEATACFTDQTLAPQPEAVFDVFGRDVRNDAGRFDGRTRFVVRPPSGGDFPLFAFPTSQASAPRLTLFGRVDWIVEPSRAE